MKSIKSLILIFVFLAFISGCKASNDNTIKEKNIRKVVWEQLSKSEKYEVIGNWDDGKVEKVIIPTNSPRYWLKDKEFEGKEVYLVTFRSKNEPILGNIQKIVDKDSLEIVGSNLRD